MSTDDPILPYLLDVLQHPASRHLVLAGGYGLQLKRTDVLRRAEAGEARTLVDPGQIPQARATADLDFFLRLEAFVRREGAAEVRTMLDALGYSVSVGSEHWKFCRPLSGVGVVDKKLFIDLHARPPEGHEVRRVRADERRVRSREKTNLHGRNTPEAFAVEDHVLEVEVADGVRASVPHPFPWICMKIVAAHDWLIRRGTGQAKPASEKHAHDVYLLVAMLTPEELEQCDALHRRYAGHPQLARVREAAVPLFGAPDAPGFVEASRIVGRPLDHRSFWEAVLSVLGLSAG